MKKLNSILFVLILFLCGVGCVRAADYSYYCTKEAASQLAKIIYKEVGADSAVDRDDNIFMRFSTAAVVINNANSKSGSSFYEKIYNLTDSNYEGYSLYKDKSFEEIVPIEKRSEVLFIAEQVLTGKYTFPTNMTLQASKSVVETYGIVWGYVKNKPEYKDVYFGYEQSDLNENDIYGNKVLYHSVFETRIHPDDFKNLAIELISVRHSHYSVDNVCSAYRIPSGSEATSDEKTSTEFPACVNPDILRVIYFCLIIIDIVKIIIPIALIVFGLIDFSKSIINNDEGTQKKNVTLFVKRILYGVLIFAVPWIVEVVMIAIGDSIGDPDTVNFTDCLQNANSTDIEKFEKLYEKIEEEEKKCDGKVFVLTYYLQDKKTIEYQTVSCTNTEMRFFDMSGHTLYKGLDFKGWDFKNNSANSVIFNSEQNYIITEEFLEDVENEYGGFRLYPIFK